MKAFLNEEDAVELVELVELLEFVADLCVAQPEELNVARCRFTASYFPAAELQAAVCIAADRLRAAMAPRADEAAS